jgi:hypothetical protein
MENVKKVADKGIDKAVKKYDDIKKIVEREDVKKVLKVGAGAGIIFGLGIATGNLRNSVNSVEGSNIGDSFGGSNITEEVIGNTTEELPGDPIETVSNLTTITKNVIDIIGSFIEE